MLRVIVSRNAKEYFAQSLKREDYYSEGQEITTNKNDFAAAEISGQIILRSIHRQKEGADVFFVANLARINGSAECSFAVVGKQPELWNPVTGEMRDLPEFEMKDGRTIMPLKFTTGESCFVVFRREVASPKNLAASAAQNYPLLKSTGEISGAWQVSFDPKWGGPKEPVTFEKLDDWTQRAEPGIKYFSGTAVYTKTFDLPDSKLRTPNCFWISARFTRSRKSG